ncbi:MAG: ABC-F family ATP-binding cassette domain-containing protein [Clostridia bacterium]|nr:ABC-F family ATP-binding cassette domain-containing protein [Clostridia bacterium]
MSLLSASGLTKTFGDRVLFENAAFAVEKGDKIGFIGANGAGKTTLFKIIIGNEASTKGEAVRQAGLKIGYLEQHACSNEKLTALEETLTVFADLQLMENELEQLNLILLNSSDEKLIERQVLLTEKFQSEGGLTYFSRTEAVLTGLGFSKEEIALPVSALSGGQRSKIGLAKLLLCKNDLILLDEPTNHLDIESIVWLEEFLISYSGAAIIISHDRFFLDKVTTKTMELENRKIYFTKGNFSRYMELKAERVEAERRDFENKSREIKRIEGIIEQQKRWNREKNIKTAESKQKQIDRIAKTMEKPESETHNVKINFNVRNQTGATVLTVTNDRCDFENATLYKNSSFIIERGERVCLIGPNGVGKSTLLKRLVANEGNAFLRGVGVEIGYFDQFQDSLNPKNTPFEEVHSTYPFMADTTVRNALAAFEFKGDDVFKLNSELSGGERARVALCKLVLSGNNFLVLDEPTNHLDLYSRTSLEKALQSFEGTLFIVSHDRYFINRIANKIILLKPDETVTIKGNYDDYLAWCEKNAEAPIDLPKAEEPIKKGKEDYINKKKQRSELTKLRTAVSRCEKEIAELEAKSEELKAQIEDCGTDYQKLTELTTLLEEVDTNLLLKMDEWEAASAELSKMVE